jgi:hypothetical protein
MDLPSPPWPASAHCRQAGLRVWGASDAAKAAMQPCGRPDRVLFGILAFSVALARLVLAASGSSELRFLTKTDLPGLGIQVFLMPDAVATPLPSPTVFLYEKVRGEQRQKVELYDPLDLWRQEQHAGLWRAPDGQAVAIARASIQPLDEPPRPHLTREEFDEAVKKAGSVPGDCPAESLRLWIERYAGLKPLTLAPVPKRPPRLRDLLTVTAPGQPAHVHVYAFRMNRSATGQIRAPLNWFLATIQVPPDLPAAKAREAILSRFFGQITATRPPEREENGPSTVFQNPQTQDRVRNSAAYRHTREQVAASIRNLKDWWYVETPHYLILSNLKSGQRSTIQKLQEEIEWLWAAYSAWVPPRLKDPPVSVIRVFDTEQQYLDYVGASYAWTGGVWVPDKQELVIRPADFGSNREDAERIRRAVYHEGFHQFVFHALDRVVPPPWFNEGHAALIENAEVRNGVVTVVEDERRAEALRALAQSKQLPRAVAGIVAMDYPAFYGGSDAQREANYAVAWGLAYYLRKGIRAERRSAHAKLLDTYAEALWRTQDTRKADATVLTQATLDRLGTDMTAFWGSTSRRNAARRETPFATPLRPER